MNCLLNCVVVGIFNNILTILLGLHGITYIAKHLVQFSEWHFKKHNNYGYTSSMIELSTQQITLWLESFIWPFFRIAAVVMTMVTLQGRFITAQMRVALAFLITLVVLPALPPFEVIDPLSAEGILTGFHQIIIGAVLGFLTQLAFQTFIFAGQLLAMLAGLSMAQMNDPSSGASVPIIGQFYLMLVSLLFLSINGHLAVFQVIVESFSVLPVASEGIATDNFMALVRSAKWIFISAVIMSLPAATTLLLVNLALGVLMRASPQLNIFAVGFPATMMAGLTIIWVGMAGFLPHFNRLIERMFNFMPSILN